MKNLIVIVILALALGCNGPVGFDEQTTETPVILRDHSGDEEELTTPLVTVTPYAWDSSTVTVYVIAHADPVLYGDVLVRCIIKDSCSSTSSMDSTISRYYPNYGEDYYWYSLDIKAYKGYSSTQIAKNMKVRVFGIRR